MKSVSLPAGAATFVANGGRDIAWTEAIAPGEHVKLIDERGEDVGLAIADPDNQRLRLMTVAAEGWPAIDGALVGVRVERAMALRKRLGIAGDGRGYRLVHGAGDGLPGLACDILGPVAVVYAYGDGLRALALKLAEAAMGFARCTGAVVKLRAKAGAADVAQEVLGKVDERCDAVESGATYEIHALGGLNTGLFTDMREHRLALARFASGATVLNLFSYTGALGLACARAGAKTVTNVDTAEGVLAWGKTNFSRNGAGAIGRFETGDAIRYLARAGKDKERYDLVIVDPPTASPARGGKGWIADRDYPDLIGKAAAVIPPGGLLWLAANGTSTSALTKLAHKGLAGRLASVLELGGLPPEYPTVVAQPGDRYLQVCLLLLH